MLLYRVPLASQRLPFPETLRGILEERAEEVLDDAPPVGLDLGRDRHARRVGDV